MAVIYEEEPHLLLAVVHENVNVDAGVIDELYKAYYEILPEQPFGVVLDAGQTVLPSVSREAFVAARDVSAFPRFKVSAIVAKSTGVRLLANFFVRTFPMAIPTRIFNNTDEARYWARLELLKADPHYIFHVEIIITGKVQGVFYRKYTSEKANKLGLQGWVKNEPSGQVRVCAAGKGEKLSELIKWCYKGSPKAKVDTVAFRFLANKHSYSNFLIEK
jgi:acylphosphatase